MINELKSLSRTLSEMGISPEEWHREYKLIPKVNAKSPCIQLWLGSDGEIKEATEMSAEYAAVLRKYGDNQSTFPAFNIVPLYRITDEDQLATYERLLKGSMDFSMNTVKSLCVSDNWRSAEKKLPDINRKAYACTVTRSEKLLQAIRMAEPASANIVTALIAAAEHFKASDTSFREALERCIFAQLAQGVNPALYLKLLIHPGDAKKPHEKDRGSVSVMLDHIDWKRYGKPVAHPEVTRWINAVLLCAGGGDAGQPADALDAFGAAYAGVGEPMPEVKLRGFAVTLRAMFNANSCQYRYGTIDDGSYPLTKENRAVAQSALGWIARDENRGKTWQTTGKDEIFFIYPSVLPKTIPNLTVLFAKPPEDEDGDASKTFIETARHVTDALLGLPPAELPKSLRVFTLQKMDKARTKIVFTRQSTPEGLRDAAIRWQQGCANIPPVDVLAFPDKKREPDAQSNPRRIRQITPFPLEVPRVVNNVWKQDGDRKAEVKRMKNDQAMALLLDEASEQTAAYFMSALLSNTIGLFVHTGNQQHQTLATFDKRGEKIAHILSVMGLLLYQCGRTKEDYMENSMAYQIGQLLKVSDELHAMYCTVVRNGDVPPQLAGNGVFVAATDAPIRALSILCTRMMPYIAWASKYSRMEVLTKKQESWKAGWYLRLYQTISDRLQPMLLGGVKFNDLDKAQMFLGYLASFPKLEKTGVDVQDDNTNEMEEEKG